MKHRVLVRTDSDLWLAFHEDTSKARRCYRIEFHRRATDPDGVEHWALERTFLDERAEELDRVFRSLTESAEAHCAPDCPCRS